MCTIVKVNRDDSTIVYRVRYTAAKHSNRVELCVVKSSYNHAYNRTLLLYYYYPLLELESIGSNTAHTPRGL
jgi:hypothetical protein